MYKLIIQPVSWSCCLSQCWFGSGRYRARASCFWLSDAQGCERCVLIRRLILHISGRRGLFSSLTDSDDCDDSDDLIS